MPLPCPSVITVNIFTASNNFIIIQYFARRMMAMMMSRNMYWNIYGGASSFSKANQQICMHVISEHFRVIANLKRINIVHNYTEISLSQCTRFVEFYYCCCLGLVNFINVVAYCFCPSWPAAFTQSGASTLADLCIILCTNLFPLFFTHLNRQLIHISSICI